MSPFPLQNVWGLQYIDELVHLGVNADPVNDPDFDPDDVDHDPDWLWVIHDEKYNVMAVLDDTAVVAERYEYTPYGGRAVFIQAGSNDPDALTPASSRSSLITGQPYGRCEFGHQGLLHDEVIVIASGSLVYNRARHLDPSTGRFLQRDPLGYIDGQNLHLYLGASPSRSKDPYGLQQVSDNKTDSLKQLKLLAKMGNAIITESSRSFALELMAQWALGEGAPFIRGRFYDYSAYTFPTRPQHLVGTTELREVALETHGSGRPLSILAPFFNSDERWDEFMGNHPDLNTASNSVNSGGTVAALQNLAKRLALHGRGIEGSKWYLVPKPA